MGLPLMAFEQACVMTKFITYTSYTMSDKNSCISQATTWLMYMSHPLACKLASSRWAILTKRFLMQVEFLALNALRHSVVTIFILRLVQRSLWIYQVPHYFAGPDVSRVRTGVGYWNVWAGHCYPCSRCHHYILIISSNDDPPHYPVLTSFKGSTDCYIPNTVQLY